MFAYLRGFVLSMGQKFHSKENQRRLRIKRMGKHRLQMLIEDAGMLPHSYSGRGMYGHECLAIDCDSNKLLSHFSFILDAAKRYPTDALVSDLEILTDAMRQACTDEMGLGTVIYWPRIEYIGG